MRALSHTTRMLLFAISLSIAGCADWAPKIAQTSQGPAISDQSLQAVKNLTAALASFEENHITGGDFIQNDPWMIAVVGVLLVLSPYVFGKTLWLLMGRVFRLIKTPRTHRVPGVSAE